MTAVVLSTLLAAPASAAGLGRLTVLSGIGQPLQAEIELTAVSAEEARLLQPKLASMEAFRQANIEFNPALQSLRFAVEEHSGHQIIRITSLQPISEPFVDVLLELNSASGHLVREYTFLLDSPELRTIQPAQIAPLPVPSILASDPKILAATAAAKAPTPVPAPAPAPAPAPVPVPVEKARRTVQSLTTPSARVPEVAPTRQSVPKSAKKGVTEPRYTVETGDSLSKIANQARPKGISLDQMLVALYRANPDAFINNNMNRLHAGRILLIPNAETSASVSPPDAHGIVVAQAIDFNEYRNKLAGRVATSQAQKASVSRQSARGTVKARVDELPTAAGEALDKLKLSKTETGKAIGKTTVAVEDRIAAEKSAADSTSRVKDLEKNVSSLQTLLDIKNKDLASRQNSVLAKPALPVPAAVESAPLPQPKSGTEVPVPVPVASTWAAQFAKPLVQAGSALLLLLLGVALYFRSRARSKVPYASDGIAADSPHHADDLADTASDSSSEGHDSVFDSSFSPPAAVFASNASDPVAEADVYIAYGRDAQAEEILKQALLTQPERHAVRLKLLEIYATRKDLLAFDSVATEFYILSKGEGEEWAQAAAMGLALDRTNPLYANASVSQNASSDRSGQLTADTAGSDVFSDQASQVHPFAATLAATREQPVPEEMDDILDFEIDGLHFDTPDQNASSAVTGTAAHSEAERDRGLSATDFDLQRNALPVNAVPAHEAASAPVAATARPAPLEFDLSGITLELPESMARQSAPVLDLTVAQNPTPPVPEEVFGALDLGDTNPDSDSASSAEMATKLDLAAAYQEIGDQEGARELLDEVVKKGNATQSQKARSILALLHG